MSDAKNIRIDASPAVGAVALAPLGTTLPLDATTALVAAYVSVGIIGSDGVDLNPSMSSSDIQDMNGNVVATIETGYKTEFSWPMLETNEFSLALYNDGSAVTVTPGTGSGPDLITVKGGAPLFDHNVAIITTVSNGLRSRTVIPDCKVTGRDSVKVSGTAATQRMVTVTAYPFDDEGHTYTSYIEVPSA